MTNRTTPIFVVTDGAPMAKGMSDIKLSAINILTSGSPAEILGYANDALSRRGSGAGYQVVAEWIKANQHNVRPECYVALFAEAYVSSIPFALVERAFPDAMPGVRALTQELLNNHPQIVDALLFGTVSRDF